MVCVDGKVVKVCMLKLGVSKVLVTMEKAID